MADPIIKIGSTGEAVRKAQHALYCRRYLVDLSEVDGVFGPITRNRVIRLRAGPQRRRVLRVLVPAGGRRHRRADDVVPSDSAGDQEGVEGQPGVPGPGNPEELGAIPTTTRTRRRRLRQADRNGREKRPVDSHRLRQRSAEGRRHRRPEDMGSALRLSARRPGAGARCQRPGPGGPAKACAIVNQRSASSPSAATSSAAGGRRWVTSRQKSSAEPATRCAASSGPHVQAEPSGALSSTRNGSAGGARPLIANAKSRVRTPMCAIERSRAVAGRARPGRRRRRGRAPRSPSAARWPSTRRSSAVRTTAACGPSATVSSASCSRLRVCRQSASSRRAARGDDLFGARVDEAARILGRAPSSCAKRGFVGDRQQRDPVGPQQVGDLMGDASNPVRGVARPIARRAGRPPARRGRRSRRADRRRWGPQSPCGTP